jgi:two-component system C4-dicarboxylate transport sensor histidine kinase DctB
MTVVHPGIIVASAMDQPNPPSGEPPAPRTASPPDCPEASLTAHDLRNLLTGVIGQAEVQRHLLKRRSPDRPLDLGAMTRSLESVIQAAAHAEVLCREMLALADDGPPRLGPVRVAALVEQVLSSFTVHPLDLEVLADGPEDLVVHGQHVDLSRSLLNLMWNACEAMQETEARRIELRWGGEDRMHWIRVADNGPGLPQGHLGDLTEPYRSHKDGEGRLRGLGLHLVARVMHRHGGRLLARNREDGPGAVFELQFGVAPELDFDTPADASRPRVSPVEGPGGR